MSYRIIRSLLVLVLIATAGTASVAAAPATSRAPKLRWLDRCPVGASPATRCGELEVLERRDRPGGRTIIVPIAVISAPDQARKAPDPFLFLMGGTGGGYSVLQQASIIPSIVNRDVIVVEQRGNPMARPFFGCENVPPTDRLHIIYNSQPQYTGPASVAKCKADIKAKKADLNAYMTPSAAEDLVDLRHALGITSWNVYGVSYGVRVATTLMRSDQAAMRTMILDSGQVQGLYFSPWQRLRAIGNFFDRCAAAPSCGAQFPELRANFEATMARLSAEPAAITVAGRPDRLSASDFLHLVTWPLYEQGLDAASRVPAAVMAAGRGDYGPILGISAFFGSFQRHPSAPNIGYNPASDHNAQQVGMLCGEEFAYNQNDKEENAAVADGWKPTTVAVAHGVQTVERKICREWGFRPSDVAQSRPPVGNTVPTLITYGEHDTIALPEHGMVAEKSMGNARLVVFPWTGHAQIEQRTTCAFSVIVPFLANPKGPLNTGCVGAIPEPAWVPYTAFNGDSMGLMRAHVGNAVAKFGLPGRAVYVIAPRIGVEGVAAAGRRDAATDAALTGTETVRIASMTKTFTAAAVLRLVEDGKLQLDQPIEKLISPPLAALLREGGHDPSVITVRQLLAHTSGLADYAMDPPFMAASLGDPKKRWTRLDQVRWGAVRLKPVAKPGAVYHYSDTGYILLGDIVERATGLGQAAAYRRLLDYKGLGLNSTWFETLEPVPDGAPPRAHQFVGDVDATASDPSFDLYGGGGIVSTLQDQARFFTALLKGQVFHKPETLAAMLTIPPTNTTEDGIGHGLGIHRAMVDGVLCFGHGGFWGTSAYYCPSEDLTVASSRYTVSEPPGFDGLDAFRTALLMQRLRTQPSQSLATAAR